jgi:hypothetical protein
VCCHTFRANGLTNFLANGGTLENAQAMADHGSPRATQLYDRAGDEVTLDEVERYAFDCTSAVETSRYVACCQSPTRRMCSSG